MTLGFTEARNAYLNKFPASPFFDTWVPEEKFVGAEVDAHGNFTISREDDGIYGIALGPSPIFPSDWKNFSMESQGITSLPDDFKVVAEWDCYWTPTVEGTLGNSQSSWLPVIPDEQPRLPDLAGVNLDEDDSSLASCQDS